MNRKSACGLVGNYRVNLNHLYFLFLFLVWSISSAESEPESVWLLAGDTVYPTLSEAKVTVWIGSNKYVTFTDSEGRYQLAVDSPNDDELIHIQVHGDSNQQHLRMARLVGSAIDLQVKKELPVTVNLGPVSSLSTALYVLVEHESGGALPTNFSTLLPKMQILDISPMDNMVALVKAVAADLVELDSELADTLALLRDVDATTDQIDALFGEYEHWEQAVQRLEYILEDSTLYRRLDHSMSLDLAAFRHGISSAGNYRIYLDQEELPWLESMSYDGAVVADGMPGSDWIFSDRFDINALASRGLVFRPRPGTELLMAAGQLRLELYGPLFNFRDYLDWQRWRFLDVSESIGITAIDSRFTRYFPDNPELDPVSREVRNPLLHLTYRPDWLPETWDVFTGEGRWLLPICAFDFDHSGDPAWSGPFAEDLVEFDVEGNAYAERLDVQFKWSFDGAKLVLIADGLPELHLRYLGHDGHADLLMVRCIKEGAARFNIRRAVQVSTPPPQLDNLVPARFVSGFSLQPYMPQLAFFPYCCVDTIYWTIDLNENGTGIQGYLLSPDGGDYIRLPITWEEVKEGRVDIHMKQTGAAEQIYSRSWRLIRMVGDEITVLESLATSLPDSGDLDELLRLPGRYNWYLIHHTD